MFAGLVSEGYALFPALLTILGKDLDTGRDRGMGAEAAYWAVRDHLLGQYQGQWIAFADGAVIAACKTSLEVLHTPGVVERHPFVICVGREDEPYRIRRATFAYDSTYPGRVRAATPAAQ